MSIRIPRVGVGVLVVKDNKVLFGKRIASHGSYTWAPPGGHLEYQESFEACAQREAFEEAGIIITNIRFAACTNDIFFSDDKHYVTVMMRADYGSGDVTIKEPAKCERWEWFTWNELPSPLFLPMQNVQQQGFIL